MTKVGAVSRAHESSLGTTTTSAPGTPASAPRAAPAPSALAVIVSGSQRATARATSTYVARAFSKSTQFSGRHGRQSSSRHAAPTRAACESRPLAGSSRPAQGSQSSGHRGHLRVVGSIAQGGRREACRPVPGSVRTLDGVTRHDVRPRGRVVASTGRDHASAEMPAPQRSLRGAGSTWGVVRPRDRRLGRARRAHLARLSLRRSSAPTWSSGRRRQGHRQGARGRWRPATGREPDRRFRAADRAIGAEVEASGQDSRNGIRRTAVVAGLGVGILPARARAAAVPAAAPRWRRYVGAIAAALPAPRATRRSTSTWRAGPSTLCRGILCGRSRRTRGVMSGGASAGHSRTRSSNASGCDGAEGAHTMRAVGRDVIGRGVVHRRAPALAHRRPVRRDALGPTGVAAPTCCPARPEAKTNTLPAV